MPLKLHNRRIILTKIRIHLEATESTAKNLDNTAGIWMIHNKRGPVAFVSSADLSRVRCEIRPMS